MRKKTLLLLLVAVFLMLVGVALFLFPIFTTSTNIPSVTYTAKSKFQQIEIDLEKTDFSVCSAEETYIEISGYRESEYYISEENGKLLLTDCSEKSPLLFKLSGLGKYAKEILQPTDQKKVILHLSNEDSHKPLNIILQNSNLTLSASVDYLTINAAHSSIISDNMTFDRFSGRLTDCDSMFSILYPANEFSRNIETHATKLSLNGDERANTEQYTPNFQKPYFILETHGGICRLTYPQNTP